MMGVSIISTEGIICTSSNDNLVQNNNRECISLEEIDQRREISIKYLEMRFIGVSREGVHCIFEKTISNLIFCNRIVRNGAEREIRTPEAKPPRAFQARALPGWAISA